ncbi:Uu.00g060360.m01.CDS01 [Anthostomella pinea]|uniref:Uu.00g060360.m01.CDS01 n=1 Tax=Anthostomella pinea TaxID=933095 RepID=A0AAI8VS70_9PEZI|nr:Uu.00g060360.m01.CDS01 [Anthostomella pinea]
MATQRDAEPDSSGASSSGGGGAGGAGPAAVATSSTDKSDHSSTSTPGNKADAPDDSNHGSLPTRDKEAFRQFILSQAASRDQVNTAGVAVDMNRQEKYNKEQRKFISDYKLVRNDYRPWFTPSRLYGEGYSGYGNGRTEIGGPSRVMYPQQKPRPGKRQTPPLKWKRKDMKQQADQHEELVPVRLDVDWDKIKLRDTFTWNLHERLVHGELFAMQLIEDVGLKPPVAQPVYDEVMKQMHEQLNDFYPFVFSDEDALDPELPYSAWKNDEMRILVKLNITIGQHTLVDQFEWEINNPLNSPEEFAASMSKDLALSGEFTTAIAHCIREQSQLFTRSLYSIGHPFDGRPIEDADLVSAFLPSPLPSVFRPQQQAKEYAPYLYELNEADLERNEMVFSREQRRQKRSINRRGGPSLPDLKERQRTIRTLVVSSTLPGAAETVEESRLYKRVAGAPAAGRRRGQGARDGDISDSDDSDDSSPDSPAASQLTGTARTRGMRGAASTAQQRMANIGRSETPEATIHHHETRVSRRSGRELTREATEEPQRFLVVLKVPKEKLRRLARDFRLKNSTPIGSQTPLQSQTRAPSASAPSSMPPPSTPNASIPAPLARMPSNGIPPGQIGRVEAPAPIQGVPPPAPPPPPSWLVTALDNFKQEAAYANDRFEGIMRYNAVDTLTGQVAGQSMSPHVRWFFLPRIRCLDCPGKLYTPGPDMSASNFEVFRSHLEDWTPENWTSHLHETAGHKKFFGKLSNYADFTYVDKEGKMLQLLRRITRNDQLLPESVAKDVTYHIEVKTTTKDWAAPFYFGADQIAMAKRLALCKQGSSSKDVYLILRVFRLLDDSWTFRVCVDPCGENGVWMIRPAANIYRRNLHALVDNANV